MIASAKDKVSANTRGKKTQGEQGEQGFKTTQILAEMCVKTLSVSTPLYTHHHVHPPFKLGAKAVHHSLG
jgi:hypothetical protein